MTSRIKYFSFHIDAYEIFMTINGCKKENFHLQSLIIKEIPYNIK